MLLLSVHMHIRHVRVCGHVCEQVKAAYSVAQVLFSREVKVAKGSKTTLLEK